MATPVLENGMASPQSLFATSTTQFHPVGTRANLGSRVFQYARSSDGTGFSIGRVLQAAAAVANHTTQTGAFTGTTVGTTRVSVVLGATAMVANQYAEGYLQIQSATTGAGQNFKLRTHAAAGSGATATFDLYDPIATALTGTITWSLKANNAADVILMPATTPTGSAAGVNMVDVPAASTTAPVFFWVQTWGEAAVQSTGSLVAGTGVAISGTAGSIAVEGATTVTQRFGVSLHTLATASVFAPVYLMIAP
jgi:hypothetical protein